MIGGVTTQRARASTPKLKQRRQFKGVARDNALVVGKGAYVTTIARDGTPVTENVWDPSLRLYANIGEPMLVIAADIVAVHITHITQHRWSEVWKVSPAIADGAVLVMKIAPKLKGPKR